MNKKVSAIPEGYDSITAYLIVDGAAEAIDFYKNAFNAVELMRMGKPGEKIGHAELKLGNSKIMLADECPSMDALSPKNTGGSPVGILFYVEDVDKVVKQAISKGAKILRPLENMFYGDRSATLEDPFGHKWTIATHIEDVSPEEMKKRQKELFGK